MNFESSTYKIADVCFFSKAQEEWGCFGNMTGIVFSYLILLQEDCCSSRKENNI